MSSASAIASQLRSGSWASGAPRSGGDPCASIPGFFGWALTYVQPLPSWFDDLLGDPAAVAGFANGWVEVECAAAAVKQRLAHDLALVDDLDGRSIRKLRERYQDLIPVVNDTGEWAGAASAALRLASTIVSAVRQFICDFLVKLSNFWNELFEWSWNPLDKWDDLIRFADAAGELIDSGQRLLDTMFTALRELATLLEALKPLVLDALVDLKDTLARMVGGPVGDLLRNTPGVEELDPGTLRDERSQAYDEFMDRGAITSPVDLLDQNRLIDKISGSESTSISVQTVRRPDGSEYSLVTLPSTLDWGLLKSIMGDAAFTDTLKDYGPMNDLDSNIALMLLENPWLKTQYERAVLGTLADAGVRPGSDVVWSGFSQGGIMAANLGADAQHGYNTIGLVTNGAPVQTFNVARDVPFLRVEHDGDIVHKLDGWNGGRPVMNPGSPYNDMNIAPPPNHDVVSVREPDSATDEMTKAPIGSPAHNAQTYRDSLAEYMRNHEMRNDWSFLNGQIVDSYVGEASE